MAHRRSLLAILLLAASLHAWSSPGPCSRHRMASSSSALHGSSRPSPGATSSEGPTSIRSTRRWWLIAEPIVSTFTEPGPDAWRLAAQLVAALASLGVLVPVYFLTESLFDRRIAFMAAGVLALLPRAAEVGHETLADSLGLFATFIALWLAARALKTGDRLAALGPGLSAGAGYLARPEVILVPPAIALTWLVDDSGRTGTIPARAKPALSVLLASAGLVVIGYAAVKGEVSEKLAVRYGGGSGRSRSWSGPCLSRCPVAWMTRAGTSRPRKSPIASRSGAGDRRSGGSSANGGRSCAGSSP